MHIQRMSGFLFTLSTASGGTPQKPLHSPFDVTCSVNQLVQLVRDGRETPIIVGWLTQHQAIGTKVQLLIGTATAKIHGCLDV